MKQFFSIHFCGVELLVEVIDFYLNWLGIISPGVPNLFGCFTLQVLDGPESSEPWAIQSIDFAKKKKIFPVVSKNREFNEIIPNSNAYQMGMTSPSLQLWLLRCIRSKTADPCQNVTDPGFDNAPGKSLLSKTQLKGESSIFDSFFLLWIPKVTFFPCKK